jgi:hypothetical protein
MFSELVDLLQPKRRKISSQLLVAIQSVRAWLRAGFGTEGETAESLPATRQLTSCTTWGIGTIARPNSYVEK